MPFLTDDPEVHDPPDFPDAAVHRGREAVLARYRQWQEALGPMPVEILELIPEDSEHS
jgi:hypothetical protein